ncbi:hypothetical protein [Paenibacillus glycinis]|uniref:Uncharacterized protein n=1 Tax=Paenibacillus glycinis TaxID=2697035 RepID=A0ABW9XPS3_9BACL|nr:hypothetical protein [Paenibacillus glycinis]NBD24632.1 hypothetical protein [Paenibacillus glycinis]
MRIFTRAISVWKQGELIDSAMIIQSHDEDTVISAKNERYEKSAHQFFYGSHL